MGFAIVVSCIVEELDGKKLVLVPKGTGQNAGFTIYLPNVKHDR